MNKRRDKLEIIHDILKSVQDKNGIIKPTHLLYKSNLSYKKMTEYITELMQKDMIKEELLKGKKMYVLTPKGIQFIGEYKRLKEFTESFGL